MVMNSSRRRPERFSKRSLSDAKTSGIRAARSGSSWQAAEELPMLIAWSPARSRRRGGERAGVTVRCPAPVHFRPGSGSTTWHSRRHRGEVAYPNQVVRGQGEGEGPAHSEDPPGAGSSASSRSCSVSRRSPRSAAHQRHVRSLPVPPSIREFPRSAHRPSWSTRSKYSFCSSSDRVSALTVRSARTSAATRASVSTRPSSDVALAPSPA